MSSQGQGVLEGEVNGPLYDQLGEDPARPVLNGPVLGEQRRSVSYGAALEGQGLVTGTSRAGVSSGQSDDVHNIHERATHAQGTHTAAAAVELQEQQPLQGRPEIPANTPTDAMMINTQNVGGVFRAGEYQGAVQRTEVSHGQSGQQAQTVESAQGFAVQMERISPPEELPMAHDGGQGNQAVWMVRLGEFFQRRVSQAAATMAPMLERPRSRTITSPPASWMTPTATVTRPLFSPEAERAMQQWPQQAPLLHGAEMPAAPAIPRDTESSSGSLTQEQVLLEVRRQVQLAMRIHNQELRALQDENQRLRAVVDTK